MGLTLTIDNFDSLPDGGPLSIAVTGKRGLDIGRDQYLDWTLPDASRTISGKHCEVRCQDGGYVLYDVSTNGTFLNGAQHRMQSPHRLRQGDVLAIGPYFIRVDVQPDEARPGGAVNKAAPSPDDLWRIDGDAPSPIDPRELRPQGSARPVHEDFLHRAMDRGSADAPFPWADPDESRPQERRAAASDALDWAPPAPPRLDEAPPPPPVPTPRRAAVPPPAAVWGDAPGAAAAPEQGFGPEAVPPVSARATGPNGPEAASVPLAEFVARFAQGAGLPPERFADRDGLLLAQLAGELLRDVVIDMMKLLGARNEAKRLSRSVSQTVIRAEDNNPLKFSPTPEDALGVMLGPPTRSYLDARRALAQGFSDIKSHQVRTYAAMQAAMRAIMADLHPDAIAASAPPPGGLSDMIGSRKARLWDAYVTRWQAKTEGHDDGMVDVFMLAFAENYDRGVDSKG